MPSDHFENSVTATNLAFPGLSAFSALATTIPRLADFYLNQGLVSTVKEGEVDVCQNLTEVILDRISNRLRCAYGFQQIVQPYPVPPDADDIDYWKCSVGDDLSGAVNLLSDLLKRHPDAKNVLSELFRVRLLDKLDAFENEQELAAEAGAWVSCLSLLKDSKLVNELSVRHKVELWSTTRDENHPIVVLARLGTDFSTVEAGSALFDLMANLRSETRGNLTVFHGSKFSDDLQSVLGNEDVGQLVVRWSQWWSDNLVSGKKERFDNLHADMVKELIDSPAEKAVKLPSYLRAFYETWPDIAGWHYMRGNPARSKLKDDVEKIFRVWLTPDLEASKESHYMLDWFFKQLRPSSNEGFLLKSLSLIVEVAINNQSNLCRQLMLNIVVPACFAGHQSFHNDESKRKAAYDWRELHRSASLYIAQKITSEDWHKLVTAEVAWATIERPANKACDRQKYLIEHVLPVIKFAHSAWHDRAVDDYRKTWWAQMFKQIVELEDVTANGCSAPEAWKIYPERGRQQQDLYSNFGSKMPGMVKKVNRYAWNKLVEQDEPLLPEAWRQDWDLVTSLVKDVYKTVVKTEELSPGVSNAAENMLKSWAEYVFNPSPNLPGARQDLKSGLSYESKKLAKQESEAYVYKSFNECASLSKQLPLTKLFGELIYNHYPNLIERSKSGVWSSWMHAAIKSDGAVPSSLKLPKLHKTQRI